MSDSAVVNEEAVDGVAPPVKPRSRLNAADRRDQLLDVLVQVIRSEGYEHVTMARLATAAAVNPSLLMHHFGSKEKLMLALVQRTLERYSDLFRQMPQQGNARARLVRVMALLFGKPWMDALAAPELFAILSMARSNDEVAVSVTRMYRRYHKVLSHELAFQQDAGVVRIADAQQSARALMALVEGAHYFSDHISTGSGDYPLLMAHHALAMLGAGPLTRDEEQHEFISALTQ